MGHPSWVHRTYFNTLAYNSQIRFLNASIGLINNNHGRHIVGWDPAPTAEEFSPSDYETPCNAYAVRG